MRRADVCGSVLTATAPRIWHFFFGFSFFRLWNLVLTSQIGPQIYSPSITATSTSWIRADVTDLLELLPIPDFFHKTSRVLPCFIFPGFNASR